MANLKELKNYLIITTLFIGVMIIISEKARIKAHQKDEVKTTSCVKD